MRRLRGLLSLGGDVRLNNAGLVDSPLWSATGGLAQVTRTSDRVRSGGEQFVQSVRPDHTVAGASRQPSR